MATSDYQLADAFFGACPVTFKALQKMVMTAAKTSKTVGKRGLFGTDKHEKSVPVFLDSVKNLCNAIDVDGDMQILRICEPLSNDGNHLRYANELVAGFKKGFPNWEDAYVYWDAFYKRSQEQGIKRF